MSSSSPGTLARPPGPSGLARAIESHLAAVVHRLAALDRSTIASIIHVLDQTGQTGRTIFTFGNGGSAATAQHLANDLTMLSTPRRPLLRVMCLSANMSVFSAVANDLGYEQVFTAPLRNLLHPGDVVLGISGSGSSPNCVEALSYARARGAITIGLLGFDGGRMLPLCDHHVHVPSDDYLVIEDAHMTICHALARGLKEIY